MMASNLRWSRQTGLGVLLQAALLGVACTSSDVNYVLQLEPVLPSNQGELVTDGLDLRLVVTDEEGVLQRVIGADRLELGSATATDAGALTDAWLGVVLQQPGADPDALDIDGMVAYGELGPLDLFDETEVIDRTVLMSTMDGIGSLVAFDIPALLSASAMTASGDVYFFGGVDTIDSATPSNAIYKLSDLDGGSWSLDLVGELPFEDGLVASRATVVNGGNGELIVITGGQSDFTEFGPYSDRVVLFDPAEDVVLWDGTLLSPHSQHLVLPLSKRALLISSAGIDDASSVGADPEAEIFDTRDRTSTSVRLAGVGVWHPAGVLLDDGRGLVCGGANLDALDPGQSLPSDACEYVTSRGDVSSGPSLEIGVSMHAMVKLADGRVLLTGGVDTAVPFGLDEDATASAWIWSPDKPNEWKEIEPMNKARAQHRMVLRNDGKVWVIGGASVGGLLRASFSEVPKCAEIFDPVSETFSEVSTCPGSGSGSAVSVAHHPLHGVVVLEGIKDADDAGRKVGYLPMGPFL